MAPTDTPRTAQARQVDDLLGVLERVETRQRALDAERLRVIEQLRVSALEVSVGQTGAARDGTPSAAGVPSRTRSGAGTREIAYRSLRLELSAALGQSEYQADRSLSLAFAARHQFPQSLAALGVGAVSLAHLQVIVDAGHILGGDSERETVRRRARYERDVLRVAPEETPNRLRPIAQRIAADLSESTLVERHRAAVTLRSVRVVDLPDGMADLIARLPAEDAHAIKDRMFRIARKAVVRVAPPEPAGTQDASTEAEPGSDPGVAASSAGGPVAPGDAGNPAAARAERTQATRTLDQIRADVLTDLLLGRDVPESAGVRGHIQVVVPGAVLGPAPSTGPPRVADSGPGHAPPTHTLSRVSELQGFGVIDVETAARLADEAQWHERVTVSPDGIVLSVDQYVPSVRLRRQKMAQDQHCRAPGCRVPAVRCDLDHTVDAARGGPTSTDNLAHLCRGHHIVKHHGGWRVTQERGGIVRWVSPTGRQYPQRPPSRVRFAAVPELDPEPPADPDPASGAGRDTKPHPF